MTMYQLTDDPNVVINLETGAWIPNSGNYLWDEYQAWLAAGNTPEPAVPVDSGMV
jgi:hypothetical protein